MHKEELKDAVKDLFGDFTEGEYLRYFTSRYPRLLVHCYNAVEKEARDLLAEYFLENASAQAPIAAIRTRSLGLYGSKLIINCEDDITFSKKKVEINTLKIENISHLFLEQNRSFTDFLQRNGLNVTQLEFSEGSLKFDSMNKILQQLPNLKEIQFGRVIYEASKTNQIIYRTTCKKLVKLEILSERNSHLLQAFQECRTIQKLTVNSSEVTLEEILQRYTCLDELNVEVLDNYPVSDQHEANSRIQQLKFLRIELRTKDEKIQERLASSIQKQNNLQQFYFDSISTYSLSQSVCQQLAAHICQLKRLRSLSIFDEILVEEVAGFAANCRVANTCLEELTCHLRPIKSPSSFFRHFTNLKKLHVSCGGDEETKIKDLISSLNKSQLTSIRFGSLSSASFSLLHKLQVASLQVLVIQVNNEPEDKVAAFDVLQELLPKNPNITQFKILLLSNHDEPKSRELIPMILAALPQLERLEFRNCRKITPHVIKHIAALETLTSWKINEHKSDTLEIL